MHLLQSNYAALPNEVKEFVQDLKNYLYKFKLGVTPKNIFDHTVFFDKIQKISTF